MGAYLSQPNTVKSSSDGGHPGLQYGFSAMQGWRVSMEDAHNCIPELDTETAMFSVYDGHGGEEVALYCAKYLPEIIKEQKAYKEGKLQKALEDAFLAVDSMLTTEEVIKELCQMAGRPLNDHDDDKEKVAEEDDVDNEETALLHEEATMTIEELLTRYGQNCAKNVNDSVLAGENGQCKKSEKAAQKEPTVNGEADPVVGSGDWESRNCRPGEEATAISCSSECAKADSHAGDGGSKEENNLTAEKSEECSEEEEEEEYSSEDAENEDEDEDDSEDGEDEEEEEETMMPGMEGKEEPGSDSGTTAVVALIRGKQLIVANAGDSRCVVSEGGKAVDMSYDHKPEDELELARIKNAGGKVTMDGRVNGGLNLSRAIGDHFYKRNKNLPPEEQMISALPDIKVLTLNEEHNFMVIACDGIWNVMSSQEVVDFIHEKIGKKDENGELRTLSSIVEELLDQCLAPDTSGDGTGCDNMTCIIVRFDPRRKILPEGSKRKLEKSEPAVDENSSENSKKLKKEERWLAK
ncbi:protein phosphatase 1G isoform X2 [Ambystoma mexicanum]|uniref:protein phosphatase 1G isoform X2 n=1 Tax=Ambystoma mexicanum TaxID=8296 RepID=UPI0037E8B07A